MQKKNLIRQMNQTPPVAPSEPAWDEKTASERGDHAPGGRAVTFWLDEETQKVFTRLRVLLAMEEVKFNDSLILRTALNLLPEDPRRFVERAKELKKRDGRKLRVQKQPV
jgi:hypothetical protein